MRDKFFLSFAKNCYKDRFLFLIVLIVALIVIGPFVEGFMRATFIHGPVIFHHFYYHDLCCLSKKKSHNNCCNLGYTNDLALWSEDIPISNTLVTIGYICGLILFAFAVISILIYIFSAQVVTRQTISAAIVVYLLIALMWTFIYRLIEILYPASFAIAHSKLLDAENIYLYFSLVTITTLGYGDITPIGRQAASLAVLEAVTGQIYLVVVVAWFVGMYVSRKSKQ